MKILILVSFVSLCLINCGQNKRTEVADPTIGKNVVAELANLEYEEVFVTRCSDSTVLDVGKQSTHLNFQIEDSDSLLLYLNDSLVQIGIINSLTRTIILDYRNRINVNGRLRMGIVSVDTLKINIIKIEITRIKKRLTFELKKYSPELTITERKGMKWLLTYNNCIQVSDE